MQVKKENPDLAFGEVGKRLGELWKEITASEKSKFEDMAKKDKVGGSTAVLPCRPDTEFHCGSLPQTTMYPIFLASLH